MQSLVGGDWRYEVRLFAIRTHKSNAMSTYLTCSLVSSVTPASSTHLPRNSSPRNGLRGFFSLPYCSLRLAYCCLRVVKNHLSTNSALFAGSDSLAGATKTDGCSHQYELNSVKLVDERMKGGAVRLARSPLKEAMDCRSMVSKVPSAHILDGKE